MKLFFRKIGDRKSMVVLHGVFGSSDNLFTVCKNIASKGFAVYCLDARNHGQSPKSDIFNYDVMADDLNEFLIENNIENAVLVGHSMGGKTLMYFTQKYKNWSKLVVVDIAPRYYPTHHNHILNGLKAINLNEIKSRIEAEDIFSSYVDDVAERQFILKNLYRNDDQQFEWRINVPVISKEIYQIGSEICLDAKIEKPVLLLRGEDSSYVSDEDFTVFKKSYINAQMITVPNANHWVHATNPEVFVKSIVDFAI